MWARRCPLNLDLVPCRYAALGKIFNSKNTSSKAFIAHQSMHFIFIPLWESVSALVPPFSVSHWKVKMMSPKSSTQKGGPRLPKTTLINDGNWLTTKLIYDVRRTMERQTEPLQPAERTLQHLYSSWPYIVKFVPPAEQRGKPALGRHNSPTTSWRSVLSKRRSSSLQGGCRSSS